MADIEKSYWIEKNDTGIINQNETRFEINTVGRQPIDTFIQQNSPVNNELVRNMSMNDLLEGTVDGQLRMVPTEVVVRGKHGKVAPVVSLWAFSYDANMDLEILKKSGRYKITGYDRRVYNAICTLYMNNRNTVSLSEIFGIMMGGVKTNPSKNQLEAIDNTIQKLKNIDVYLDITDEVKHNVIEDKQPLIDAGILKNKKDSIAKVEVTERMLNVREGTIYSQNGKVFKSIKIVGEPLLLTYNKAKKTLLSIPLEYIGLEDQNATDRTIAFQDYLLMRIFGYKNGKLNKNKILYESLYRDSGQEIPKNKDGKIDRKGVTRDRETVLKMMEEWVKKGLITGFKEIKEGRTFTAVEFYIGENEQIENNKDRLIEKNDVGTKA